MKCPACGSARVSAPYPYASFDNHLRIAGAGEGFLGPKDLTAGASLARVCADCGHLALFLGGKDLERVRAVILGRGG